MQQRSWQLCFFQFYFFIHFLANAAGHERQWKVSLAPCRVTLCVGKMANERKKMCEIHTPSMRQTKKTNSHIYEDVRWPRRRRTTSQFWVLFSKQNAAAAALIYESVGVLPRRVPVISDANVSHSRPTVSSLSFAVRRGSWLGENKNPEKYFN